MMTLVNQLYVGASKIAEKEGEITLRNYSFNEYRPYWEEVLVDSQDIHWKIFSKYVKGIDEGPSKRGK